MATEWCSCGKVKFFSKSEARRSAKKHKALGRANDRKLDVYRCHRCGEFHITSRSSRIGA